MFFVSVHFHDDIVCQAQQRHVAGRVWRLAAGQQVDVTLDHLVLEIHLLLSKKVFNHTLL